MTDSPLTMSALLYRGAVSMGFIRENGAGKSTTVKLILDLVHLDEGEISIPGRSAPAKFIRFGAFYPRQNVTECRRRGILKR